MANEAIRPLWQLFSGGLTEEQVSLICDIAEQHPVRTAGVSSENSVDPEVRRSKIRWVNAPEIRDLLFEFVKEANVNAFGVNVENFAETQYTEYHATEGGHYDWHGDVLWDSRFNSDRKLSITVQLSNPSEYAGGEFEFEEAQNPGVDAKAKGSVLVFPSYLRHRVTPVSSGTRRSLVAWFYGPRWR